MKCCTWTFSSGCCDVVMCIQTYRGNLNIFLFSPKRSYFFIKRIAWPSSKPSVPMYEAGGRKEEWGKRFDGSRRKGGGRAKFRKRKEGGGPFLFLVSFLLLPGLERRRKGGFFSCCVSTGQEKSRGLTANWYNEPWNVSSTETGFKHFSSLAFLSLGFKSWKGMFVSVYMRRNALPVLPFLCFPFSAERSISQIRNVLRICSTLAFPWISPHRFRHSSLRKSQCRFKFMSFIFFGAGMRENGIGKEAWVVGLYGIMRTGFRPLGFSG